LNVSKSSDPERLHNICVANVSNQVEHFLLSTDAHNVKKRRVIKTL